MPAKRDVLLNPVVSEYLYDCMVNATNEQKSNLKLKYLKAIKNSKTAKVFSAKSTMEEKAILLAKLGIRFSWVFNLSKQRLNELVKGKEKPSKLADIMLSEKVMIVTDKQVLQYLNLMAANCHSEVYMMNRDFLKVGYTLTDWKKDHYNTNLQEVKDSFKATKDMCKLMVGAMINSKLSVTMFGIPETAFTILLFMYSKDKEFLTESEIKLQFNGIYRNFKIGKSTNELLRASYIEKSFLTSAKEYRVTSMGAEAVLRFEKKIFETQNF